MDPRSFRQISLELCGESHGLGSHHIFVLLDRSLSPAGSRKLRDQRCRGFASSRPWANPGVYSIPELAKRVLTATERRAQRRLFPTDTLKPLHAVVALQKFTLRPLTATEAHLLAREAQALAPIGLSFSDWRSVVSEIETSAEPEFQTWTERIFAYLQLEALADSRDLWASDWSIVARATRALNESRDWAWGEIFERPAQELSPEVIVPASCEAYPLEREFLRALATHLPVQEVRPRTMQEEDPPPELRVERLDEHATDDLAIHWASFDPLPSATETAELLPGEGGLDVPEPVASHTRQWARALFLFCDFERHGRPAHHPFVRGDALAKRLASEGFRTEDPLTLESLLTFLGELNPELKKDLPTVPLGSPVEWVRILDELGYLDTESPENAAPAPSHPRLSVRGASLLSLGDLGLTGHRSMCLWGSREKLTELCDPVSKENLKRRVFPPKLKGLLAALGATMPDPTEEAHLLKGVLHELHDRIFLLAETRHTSPALREPMTIPVNLPLTAYRSPSSLEAFFKCPLRFYLERSLKLKAVDEWDLPGDDALKLGQWIHRCLEMFFDAPDWEAPEQRLRSLLLEKRDEFFGATSTASYKRILESRAEGLSELLSFHVETFERPLAELRAHAKPAREIHVSGEAFGLTLQGILDRVDVLDENHVLVWDYKSGDIREKKAETQIEHGRFQWFLYREILRGTFTTTSRVDFAGARVVGGGYLNPLDPEKSALFVSTDGNPYAERLMELFERTGHRFQSLSDEQDLKLDETLRDALTELRARMSQGEIPAKPAKDQDCDLCAQQAVCGRPGLTT